jgi:RecA/RadA recombinase
MYGSPETTPGGAALRFYSHQRIRAAPKEKIKVKDGAGEKIVGILSTATFVKNKLAMPFGKAEFKIIFDPKSLNPVVMLCNAAKAVKLIRPFNGILRLQKEVTGKVMDSGVTTIPEFADFLIKNNLVIPLLDKVVEEMEGDPTAEPLDGVILEMKDDPTKIVSPTSDEPLFDAEKVDDATIDEIADDIKDQDKPVEE